MMHVDPSQIRPETSARLDRLVSEFVDRSPGYYQRVFRHMMQAPGYRFTLNGAAALLGPIWFGARGLWSWFLGVLLFDTLAFILMGMGLFGDLGREARLRADQIAQTLELRRQQVAAAEASGAASLDNLRRAAEALEGAQAGAQAAARTADAGGILYFVGGLALLAAVRFGAAALANWTLEAQFARWRSDRGAATARPPNQPPRRAAVPGRASPAAARGGSCGVVAMLAMKAARRSGSGTRSATGGSSRIAIATSRSGATAPSCARARA